MSWRLLPRGALHSTPTQIDDKSSSFQPALPDVFKEQQCLLQSVLRGVLAQFLIEVAARHHEPDGVNSFENLRR